MVHLRYQVVKVSEFWYIFCGLRLRSRSYSRYEREGIVSVLAECIEGIEPWSSAREIYRAVSGYLRENKKHIKGFDPSKDARAFHKSLPSYLKRKCASLNKSPDSQQTPLVEGLRARNQ